MIRYLSRPALIATGLFFLTQCQTSDKDLSTPAEPVYQPETYNSAAYTEYEAQKEVEAFQPQIKRSKNPFDLEPWIHRPEVQKWIRGFSGPGKNRFIRHLKRGEALRPIIESILNDKGLPTDLYYLALIESGFRPQAKSHKAAVGVWQFIRGTGKRYGLRSNYYVDERRDPIRSTLAAAGYLSDLYRVFQSWFLAFSAYSTGEGRVLGAIMRHETRNYWSLIEKKGLPAETRNYVPKLIAAAWVARNPKLYGLPPIEAEPYPELQGVKVPGGVSLKSVSRTTGISLKQIETLNPHLLRGVVPPGRSSYSLWLPRNQVSKGTELALVRLKPSFSPRAQIAGDGEYKIRRGDSLYTIARKFKTSVSAIKRLNGLSGNRLVAGRILKIPGLNNKKPSHKLVRKNPSHKPIRNKPEIKSRKSNNIYTVRRGDSLYSIARAHKLSIRALKKLNSLRSNSIRPGQKLFVSVPKKKTPARSKTRTYKVRRGDTLFSIARKFSLTITQLKRKNALRNNRIYPGQKLRV